MAVREQDVEIIRPCPVRLDPDRVRNGARSWYCDHCQKSVHVLSNMTEREARDFLGERVGEDLCVTYAVGPDGAVRFRPAPPPTPDLVPVTALRRHGARIAAGLGLALAACTPHDHPDVKRQVELAEVVTESPVAPVIPDAPPHVSPDDQIVDGMIEPEPIPRPGGIRVAPLPPQDASADDEPCDPEPRVVVRRGQRRRPPGVE